MTTTIASTASTATRFRYTERMIDRSKFVGQLCASVYSPGAAYREFDTPWEALRSVDFDFGMGGLTIEVLVYCSGNRILTEQPRVSNDPLYRREGEPIKGWIHRILDRVNGVEVVIPGRFLTADQIIDLHNNLRPSSRSGVAPDFTSRNIAKLKGEEVPASPQALILKNDDRPTVDVGVRSDWALTSKRSPEAPARPMPNPIDVVEEVEVELKLVDIAAQRIQEAIESGATVLDLSNLGLTVLPASIGQLGSLKELHLDCNQLTVLPDAIGNLGDLEYLDLDNNLLTSIPASIGQLGSLEKLYLERNQLTSIPDSVGGLANLAHLSLERNQLTSIPDSIGGLAKLLRLDLDDNQLTEIPGSIGQLDSLEELHLEGNPIAATEEVELIEVPQSESLASVRTISSVTLELAAIAPGYAELKAFYKERFAIAAPNVKHDHLRSIVVARLFAEV